MKRKRLQFVLALLMTAATGAWAQSTTHVVTQSTVDDIFSGDGYTLASMVRILFTSTPRNLRFSS